MSTGLLAQYAVIALAVVASIAVVMRKQFPNATRRLRIALALPLLREGAPAWFKPLGRAIAPPARVAGKGCDGCDNCGPD
ncbi:hypothetical protein FNZ56_03985 [Pseudoluteimonas lycopersici]|uniref:Uncharacterized protein n=1 Tax=Pseudoluteimonas lycopersici TaxID=1324796 RepID=A0A516V3I1_9GAMM|nr:DUF6587 family protein [Lysobacter lycopersici]QDQ73091.1 hypothetical protein FNZ56_03985 [Lysobacter lycopersici]